MYFHSVFSWHKCSSHVFYVFRRPPSLVLIIFTFAIRYIKWTRKRSVIRLNKSFKAKHFLWPSQCCRRQVHWWAPLGNRAGAFYIPSPGSGHELLHSLGPDVDEDGYWIWYFTWNMMMMRVVLLLLFLSMISMMRMPMIPERDSKEPQQQQTLSARVEAEGSPDRDHADKGDHHDN